MYYIYRAFNLISGKSYIGLTTRTIEERWKEHVSYANYDWGCDYNTVLSKAIRKYSPESWKVYKLDETDNLEQLKELEIHYISKYHTCISDPLCNGYNSTKGGDTGSEVLNIPVVEIEILTGNIISRFDCIQEVNRVFSVRCDEIMKRGIHFTRKDRYICFVPEYIIKDKSHDEIVKFVNNNCPNVVYQLDFDGNIINRYIDSNNAHKITGISMGNIISCCLEQRRMASGYQWCYQKGLDKRLNQKLKDLSLGKPIVQYGMDGKKIKIWKNTEEAAKTFGIEGTHITSCCTGHRQSCKKFQWRFLSDDLESLPPINQKRRVKCVETGEIFETRNHAAKHFGVHFKIINNSLNGKKINIPYTFVYE